MVHGVGERVQGSRVARVEERPRVAAFTDADETRDRAGVSRREPLPGHQPVADRGQDQRTLVVTEVVERLVVRGLEGVRRRRPQQEAVLPDRLVLGAWWCPHA